MNFIEDEIALHIPSPFQLRFENTYEKDFEFFMNEYVFACTKFRISNGWFEPYMDQDDVATQLKDVKKLDPNKERYVDFCNSILFVRFDGGKFMTMSSGGTVSFDYSNYPDMMFPRCGTFLLDRKTLTAFKHAITECITAKMNRNAQVNTNHLVFKSKTLWSPLMEIVSAFQDVGYDVSIDVGSDGTSEFVEYTFNW